VWPTLEKAHLNTALIGVGLGWTGAGGEGSTISAPWMGPAGRENSNLRVVLLWFGSWKNGTSSYPPVLGERNWEKLPHRADKDGKGREILSTLSAANREADARA